MVDIKRKKRKTITYQGQVVKISDLAQQYGIATGTLIRRLGLGWTVEESISTPVRDLKKQYEYQGKSLTLPQWSKELGINAKTLQLRLDKGLSVQESFSRPVASRREMTIQSPLYGTWLAMLGRCYNPKADCYENYGGRGIRVCERWRNSFESFVEDMGERPSLDHSIDRIENEGDYQPSNCRWATRSEQQNNRRTNRILTYNGESRTLTQWAHHLNVNARCLDGRLRRGWSVEKTLSEPVSEKHKYLTFNGKTQCIREWSDELGIPAYSIAQRINRGWTVERALTTKKEENGF